MTLRRSDSESPWSRMRVRSFSAKGDPPGYRVRALPRSALVGSCGQGVPGSRAGRPRSQGTHAAPGAKMARHKRPTATFEESWLARGNDPKAALAEGDRPACRRGCSSLPSGMGQDTDVLRKGRGGIYGGRRRGPAPSPLALAEALCRWKPDFTCGTLERIEDLTDGRIRTAIGRVPPEFMSDYAPLSQRLLVDFSGRLPPGVNPMVDLPQYRPIDVAGAKGAEAESGFRGAQVPRHVLR